MPAVKSFSANLIEHALQRFKSGDAEWLNAFQEAELTIEYGPYKSPETIAEKKRQGKPTDEYLVIPFIDAMKEVIQYIKDERAMSPDSESILEDERTAINYIAEGIHLNVVANRITEIFSGNPNAPFGSFEIDESLFLPSPKGKVGGKELLEDFSAKKSGNWGAFWEAILGLQPGTTANPDAPGVEMKSRKSTAITRLGVGKGRAVWNKDALIDFTDENGTLHKGTTIDKIINDSVIQIGFVLYKLLHKMRNFIFLSIFEEASRMRNGKEVWTIHFRAIMIYTGIYLTKVLEMYLHIGDPLPGSIVKTRVEAVKPDQKPGITENQVFLNCLMDVRFEWTMGSRTEELFFDKIGEIYRRRIGIIDDGRYIGAKDGINQAEFFAALRIAEGFASVEGATPR